MQSKSQPFKGRSFIFNLKNHKKADWKNICNMKREKKCDYIFAGKDETEINGFIRFANPKTIDMVERLFDNKATIELKKKTDRFYKELYSSQTIFNSDNIKALEDRVKEQEKIINIVETQNTKLMQNNETMIEFINAFKNSKENDSEQIRQITDLCMKIAKSTPTMVVNNTNNNFNLNVFLNEYCKDAVNIFDFAKSIQIELEDVLLFKKLGHVEAVSQIFDKAYKNLDLKMRPMHCTDVKRETLYVRNDDKWVNDETKELSKSAVEKISNNSYCKMQLWKEANPDYLYNPEKKQEYLLLMKELLGGSSDKDFEDNSRRILKNVAKNTHLDKTNALVSKEINLI
jgi:hypothetical protein